MRVRMLSTMAGPRGVFTSGQTVDLSGPEAEMLIRGGYAVAADAGQALPKKARRRRRAPEPEWPPVTGPTEGGA